MVGGSRFLLSVKCCELEVDLIAFWMGELAHGHFILILM